MDNRAQTIEFKFTGLDQDSDQRLMAPGDSRYRLNCINDSTDDGLLGDIQNIKGTLAYIHTTPTGTNITIGSCKDTKNNAIIYFVYNSTRNHQIRRFFPDTGIDEIILQNQILNFQQDYRVYHANVINGLLYWTDGYFESYEYDINNLLQFNPPRKINIDKAIKYTLGQPGGYTSITFETLDRIKYQPDTPPTLRYLYDAAQIENYLYGKMFQFAYRYRFDDNEISTWSTLSQVLLPAYNFVDGSTLQLIENTIGVTLDSGAQIVVEIEVAIRSSVTNTDGGNSYFIVSRLNKADLSIPDNTAYEYIYDGVAFKENLTADDYLRPYDYVPQISKSQEIAGGRMTDANVVEDYDTPNVIFTGEFIRYYKDTDIRTTSPDPSNPSNPNTTPWGSIPQNQYPISTFHQLGLYQPGFAFYDRAGRSCVVSTDENNLLTVPSIDVDANPFGGMLGDPLKLRLTIDKDFEVPDWATHWAPLLTKELSYIKKQQLLITQNNFNYNTGKLQLPTNSGYTFLEGDRVRMVAYSYAPVNFLVTSLGVTINGTITFDDIASYNSYVADQFYFPPALYNSSLVTQATSTFNYEIQEFDSATFEISFSDEDTIDIKTNPATPFNNHGKGPNNIIPENYFYIIEIYNKNRNTTENKIFFEVGEKYEIGNANTPTRYLKAPVQDQIPGSQDAIVDIYGFDCYLRRKKQDISQFPVLLLGADGAGTSGPNIYNSYPEDFLPYFKDADLTQVTVIDWDLVPPGLLGNYTVNTGIGFANPILGSTAFIWHTIIEQNAGTYTPDPANPFLYGIIFDAPLTLFPWIEDYAFSDDYPSTMYNDGRPNSNLETLGRRDYISRIRWSGRLFENTLINELSTVYAASYKDLSQTYNEISRIRQVGDTLKVRQKNKMTSFYLDKNMLNVNEGVDNVGQSNDFLSSPNLYDEFYGSTSPGADIQAIRTGYFLDLMNGVVIRDAGNKPLPISGDDDNAQDPFKMAKYFRDLCKSIRQLGIENFNIIGCWDEFSSLYTLTVQEIRVDEGLSQTIVFHEPTNRWKSFMSYVPEWYETLGKYVVSFKDSQPYIHYQNPLRNNFLGTQYGQEIRVTANVGRNTVKNFTNLDMYSNIAWEIPTINIPATPNSPIGMLSALPSAKFNAKEGVWHSEFLRDKNDPKYTSQVIAWLNGRRLKGETIELVMTNTSTSLVYLKALNIYINPSELTI